MIAALRTVIKRMHYPLEVMLTCVRWYVSYPLSFRHLEEMMEEHGVVVDHATQVGSIRGNRAPIESTISFSVRRKAPANHSSDRDPRGLEERIVSVHAPIVAQHVPERHARMDRESRDTVLN